MALQPRRLRHVSDEIIQINFLEKKVSYYGKTGFSTMFPSNCYFPINVSGISGQGNDMIKILCLQDISLPYIYFSGMGNFTKA
jgi:hypothetical protein